MIMFAGKGGTGKTSLASATGALAASQGVKTLIISLDPAHSLRDAFDLSDQLLATGGEPVRVTQRLWIQEININLALEQYWDDVHQYLSLLFNTAGLDQVVAEEIAVLPGMEEISALLYINDYVKSKRFDLLILDCAPTAESMRFVSMPTALDWYMNKIFKVERSIAKVARPIAKRLSDIPLPGDEYFACIERLSKGLNGVNQLLCDPSQTTVRLVSLAEKMVLRETQRALTYFCLHGLSVEAVLLNRMWPAADEPDCLSGMRDKQSGYLEMAERFFSPLPILQVPRLDYEVLGLEGLLELGSQLYGQSDPQAMLYGQQPLVFSKQNGFQQLRMHLPFTSKDDIEVHTSGDELIIKVGVLRKHVALPASFSRTAPSGAGFEGDYLVVKFPQARRDGDGG